MKLLPLLLIIFEGLAFFAAVIIIIFLVIRRLEIKKKENFEKRDN